MIIGVNNDIILTLLQTVENIHLTINDIQHGDSAKYSVRMNGIVMLNVHVQCTLVGLSGGHEKHLQVGSSSFWAF